MLMQSPTLPANYAPVVPTDELIRTLELIRHATAPLGDDGGYHENAYELSDGILQRVEARKAYEAGHASAL